MNPQSTPSWLRRVIWSHTYQSIIRIPHLPKYRTGPLIYRVLRNRAQTHGRDHHGSSVRTKIVKSNAKSRKGAEPRVFQVHLDLFGCAGLLVLTRNAEIT